MGDRAGVAAHRDELLAGAAGRVIEYLRRLAATAAAEAPVGVRVIDSGAETLLFDDGCFDVAVASLVLCSVPDQDWALGNLRRVLRPGGQLRFYEHVRSDDPRRARLQDRVEWIWPHLLGGCHANRDTPAAIGRAGFRIEGYRRFEFRLGALSAPASPHVIGTATRV